MSHKPGYNPARDKLEGCPMSFMKTLATLAAGFIAARGIDKYRKGGGMPGVQDMLKQAGEPGGMADRLGEAAAKMGIPGGADAVKGMLNQMGTGLGTAAEATEKGMEQLKTTMGGAAAAGTDLFEKTIGVMTGGTGPTAAMEDNAKLMIRAMIQSAKADGAIDDAEKAAIMGHLKDASPDELAFVEDQMNGPMDMAGLVAATGDAMKTQVYATSLTSVKMDTPAEIAYLAQLATALGLDTAARNAIHASLGMPPVA
jgi:uncharacterized membrane protein YebE (DUF533 family)